MTRLILFASVGFAAGLAVSACGTSTPPVPCSADTCQGCCDATDKCRLGTEELACGGAGLACDVCVAGQVCQSAKCGFVSVIDSGVVDAGADAGTIDAGTDAGSLDAGVDGGVDGGGLCPLTPVSCFDQAILSLDLKNTVNPAVITNITEDAGFKSTIDATAGGFTPTQAFNYGKFTATGLQKVSITDETSLASVDWDIAFRRFVIRVNSGSSGYSCVKAAVTPPGTIYDTLTAIPTTAYVADDFEGPPPMCMFKDDASGLTTSPSTALANAFASFYNYNNCVGMTGRVFVIRTREGRHVKVLVTNYYPSDAAQATCNTGVNPNVAGATIKVRWNFLD